MKRFHVHIAVENLEENIRFYSSLFDAPPSVKKADYAKWMLDDPHINFAISKRTFAGKGRISHLGIQAETDLELQDLHQRLNQTNEEVTTEEGVECCYAKSNKHWIKDPQGIAWETFHSLDRVEHYYGGEEDAEATGVSLLNKTENRCAAIPCLTSKARKLMRECCQ